MNYLTATAAIAVAVALLPAPAAARTVVHIADDAPLYAAPGRGPVGTTGGVGRDHGSAWVLRRRGAWLQIPTVQRPGASRAWIRKTAWRRLSETRLLVRVDLSERRVRVSRGSSSLLSAPVGVGSPASPSPTGATSVSERILVGRASGLRPAEYGSMVVALRMRQRSTSLAYPLGGIVAFHGTSDRASVGVARSAGCFRMFDADLRRLARLVRAGTPVIISP